MRSVGEDHSADYWIGLFDREGIPSGPILTIEEMFKHPQIAARGMLPRLDHPAHGTFMTTGLAVKLSETPGEIARPPLAGEHTDTVLAAVGLDEAEIERLRKSGVIG